MHRVDGSGNVGGHWTEGDPDTAQAATEITAAILEAMQEEIIAVIAAAGIALNKPNNAQLIAALTALYVNAAGDTMTGALTLSGPPTVALHAATKAYVDALLAGAATTVAPGIIQLSTDAETQTGTNNTHAVTPQNLAARSSTTTRTGIAELATAAEVTTATDPDRIVAPSTVIAHPGVIKKSISFGPGIAPTIFKNNGIASVVRNGTGAYTVTFTVAFASANDYIPVATLTSAAVRHCNCENQLAGSVDVRMTDFNPNNKDDWEKCNLHLL